jgi:uncharacterized protein (DUF2267 family)
MNSTSDAFIAHVAAHAAISPQRAETIARTVLARIGAALSPESRRQIADELPPALASALMAPEVMPEPSEVVSVHHRELLDSVYRVLAEELSEPALASLRAELPKPVAEHLVAGAPTVDTPAVHGSSLATGKPGSGRPISESHLEPSHDTLAEGEPGSTHPISERRR